MRHHVMSQRNAAEQKTDRLGCNDRNIQQSQGDAALRRLDGARNHGKNQEPQHVINDGSAKNDPGFASGQMTRVFQDACGNTNTRRA